MEKKQYSDSDNIRAMALAVVFASAGFFIRAALKMIFKIELSKDIASILNFALAIFAAYFLFPKLLKEPFGEISLSEYTRRLGVFIPTDLWKHVVLGVILALCTLGGILISALLTGRYVLDWDNISFSHFLFSLNPGIWEEVFFRGIIMFVLLRIRKSLKEAALIQIIIFGAAHIKEMEFWSLIDVISVAVIAIAFTYSAYKTRTLVAGIVFHFLHDAFIYFVQVPDMELISTGENLLFYACLWPMVGVACWLIKIAAEKFAVQADDELYEVTSAVS